jgi:hypothetical protein
MWYVVLDNNFSYDDVNTCVMNDGKTKWITGIKGTN